VNAKTGALGGFSLYDGDAAMKATKIALLLNRTVQKLASARVMLDDISHKDAARRPTIHCKQL
jgi:hypothetical protein